MGFSAARRHDERRVAGLRESVLHLYSPCSILKWGRGDFLEINGIDIMDITSFLTQFIP